MTAISGSPTPDLTRDMCGVDKKSISRYVSSVVFRHFEAKETNGKRLYLKEKPSRPYQLIEKKFCTDSSSVFEALVTLYSSRNMVCIASLKPEFLLQIN